MRSLVGMAVVMTGLGWFVAHTSEMIGRMQDRVGTLEAAAAVREDALGMEKPLLVEKGHARADWKALLSRGEDLPTGIKQRAVWKEQTRKLLAGEPPTAPEARRARGD